MTKRTFIPLLWLLINVIAPHTSISASEAELDLQTIIAGIKHYDATIHSGIGNITFQGRMEQGKKETYKVTFDGVTYEEAQVRVDFPIGDISTEIWDGERHWEVRRAKKLLFQVNLSAEDYKNLKKAKPKLPLPVKEQLKTHKISISDDYRFEPDETDTYYMVIDNATEHFYYIRYTEEQLEFYSTTPVYGVRPQCIISPELDPRFWMTYGVMNSNAYLITPLWKLLETHKSKILQTEKINGKDTYRIKVTYPYTESITLWISPEQGFRLVKLQKITKQSNFIEENPDPKVVSYLTERILHYKEYKPEMWFPEKIEQTNYPLLATEPQKRGEYLMKTTLQVSNFKINEDVTASFQLDIPEHTLINDYGTAKERTFRDLINPKQ